MIKEKTNKKKLTPEEEAKQLEAKMKEIQKQATARKNRLAKKRMKLMAESAETYKNELDETNKRLDKMVKRLNRISQMTNVNLAKCDDANFENAFNYLKNSVELRRSQKQKNQN